MGAFHARALGLYTLISRKGLQDHLRLGEDDFELYMVPANKLVEVLSSLGLDANALDLPSLDEGDYLFFFHGLLKPELHEHLARVEIMEGLKKIPFEPNYIGMEKYLLHYDADAPQKRAKPRMKRGVGEVTLKLSRMGLVTMMTLFAGLAMSALSPQGCDPYSEEASPKIKPLE